MLIAPDLRFPQHDLPATPARESRLDSSRHRLECEENHRVTPGIAPGEVSDSRRAPSDYHWRVPVLQRLRADHASAVLAFELANRSYFATFISDRGDEFFAKFTEQYDSLLAEQEAGTCVFHVLVNDDGAVIGRFNLVNLHDGTGELGYRVAESFAGRGVATKTVQQLCRLAAAQYGLLTLSAATTLDNVASQKVLTKAGFHPAGPAEPGGRPGTWYQRALTSD